MSNAPKPVKQLKRIKTEWWKKTTPQGGSTEHNVPAGEPPICCPDSKQPTPQPVERPWEHKPGTRICVPSAGGCGSTWTPPQSG